MAEGKRPGGLTALAVLNFVFGGLGALWTLGVFALITVAKAAVEAAEAHGGKYDGPSPSMYYVYVLFSAASAFLLIVSGVGYIKQKRMMGRTLGTAYGVLAIASTVFNIILLSSGFGVGQIIGLVYPLLTLILLNTTFKDDLVN